MSWTIYLMAAPDEPQELFKRALVERLFAPITTGVDGDWWNLRASDGSFSAGEVSIDDAPMIDGFCVHRPPSYAGIPEFYDALFEIMRQTRTFLVWPAMGGPGPSYCVANPAVIPVLLATLEHMGAPALITSGADIEPAFVNSGA